MALLASAAILSMRVLLNPRTTAWVPSYPKDQGNEASVPSGPRGAERNLNSRSRLFRVGGELKASKSYNVVNDHYIQTIACIDPALEAMSAQITHGEDLEEVLSQ